MTVLRVVRRGSAADMERELQDRLQPRRDIVAEQVAGKDRFEASGGPFRHYERRLSLERTHPDESSAGPEPPDSASTEPEPPDSAGTRTTPPDSAGTEPEPPDSAGTRTTPPDSAGTGPEPPDSVGREGQEGHDETWQLTEVTSYRLAVPVWAPLFHFPVRNALLRRRDSYGYWWAPPDRLDARVATVLGLLCTVQVVDGYLGTVLTQTLTFAADEFGQGNTAQGDVLAVVRIGVLLALAVAALADRHGRRRLLLVSGVGSCVITALGALSPGLWFLGGTQLVARGLSTALGILIVIMAAEEMPARSRAWAMSVLVLCAGLGSGMAVWVLPVADLHVSAWRTVYLVPLAGVAAVTWAGGRLPESRRFVSSSGAGNPRNSGQNSRHQPQSPSEAAATDNRLTDNRLTDNRLTGEAAARQRKRLVLLAASAFLILMFAAPASGLHNDFLKDERNFSAASISLFTLVTNTPIGIGVLIGGYLADRRGRRPVGAAGLVLGAVFVVWSYFADGAALWLLSLAGGILGAIAVPALAVYGPELFGTYRRGRSNAMITTVGVAGSALGNLVAGRLSDALDGRVGACAGSAGRGSRDRGRACAVEVPRDRGPGARGTQPRRPPSERLATTVPLGPRSLLWLIGVDEHSLTECSQRCRSARAVSCGWSGSTSTASPSAPNGAARPAQSPVGLTPASSIVLRVPGAGSVLPRRL